MLGYSPDHEIPARAVYKIRYPLDPSDSCIEELTGSQLEVTLNLI